VRTRRFVVAGFLLLSTLCVAQSPPVVLDFPAADRDFGRAPLAASGPLALLDPTSPLDVSVVPNRSFSYLFSYIHRGDRKDVQLLVPQRSGTNPTAEAASKRRNRHPS